MHCRSLYFFRAKSYTSSVPHCCKISALCALSFVLGWKRASFLCSARMCPSSPALPIPSACTFWHTTEENQLYLKHTHILEIGQVEGSYIDTILQTHVVRKNDNDHQTLAQADCRCLGGAASTRRRPIARAVLTCLATCLWSLAERRVRRRGSSRPVSVTKEPKKPTSRKSARARTTGAGMAAVGRTGRPTSAELAL